MGRLSLPGPQSRAFADGFAQMQGGQFAVLAANGTVTLEVALRAAGVGWGDEVIVPAYTFQATAAGDMAAGAIPVLADVDPDTYCLFREAIERSSRRARGPLSRCTWARRWLIWTRSWRWPSGTT